MKITIPEHSVSFTIPAYDIDIPDPPVVVPPVVTPPVVTPPVVTPGGIAWGYHNGVFSWAGDYSYAATIDYHDPQGIAVRTTQWGAWQPFMAKNWVYPTAGYTQLTFRLKPTVPGQKWAVRFIGVGDVPLAMQYNLDVLKYGPAPVVGVWATYTIPLADLGVLGKDVYKFAIQDQTGLPSNLFYVNDAGFVP